MMKIDLSPDESVIRFFGFFSVFGFGFMALILHWKLGAPDWLVWGLVALGAVLALAAWIEQVAVIRPVYVVMSVLGMIIGAVLGPILLALIYYGMITPFALWFRLIGRDYLQRRRGAEASSYWRIRQGSRSASSYLRLY
jgi:hypothetical protein